MIVPIYELYVLTLEGSVYLDHNVQPWHLDLVSARFARDSLPEDVKGKINIHIFRSAGIVEHGKEYDEVTEKDK